MSSESWAGPAPTPVTTDGNLNGPPPDGYGGPDGGVFFKAFSGGGANGSATGHLYQDVPATPGWTYMMPLRGYEVLPFDPRHLRIIPVC